MYLDTNTLDFGILGPAPPLPERRGKKLFNQISTEASRIFEGRGEDWSHIRLTHFDDAFSSVSEKPGCVYGLSSFNKKSVIVDESALRTAFVGFFVAIFMNYRRHLIFGTSQDPDPLVKFNFAAFLAGTEV